MSIVPNTNYLNGTYSDTLYGFFKMLEGVTYSATIVEGIPHIGVGFNLSDPTVLGFVASALGINPTANDRELFWYKQLQAVSSKKDYASGYDISFDLNSIMLNRLGDATDTVANKLPVFEINSGDGGVQLHQMFNSIIGTYEAQVDKWLGANDIVQSNERIALVSLAYNAKADPKTGLSSLLGNKLKAAIIAGDRAEAWYEIRYDSNGDGQHASRRYKESEIFGLYNDVNNVTEDDAKDAYRMYTRHRDSIITVTIKDSNGVETKVQYNGIRAYQDKYSTVQANSDYPNPPAYTVQTELDPAFQFLKTHYWDNITGVELVWDDIQVGEDQTSLYGNFRADEDILKGSSGNDLLFGESGNDILDGGQGTNVLNGGTGLDLYYYHAGDVAHDYIDDSDGLGEIVYVDANGKTKVLTAGVHQSTDPTGQYESVGDGSVIYQLNGSDLDITTPDGGTITVKNYTAGELSIHLLDSTPDPTTTFVSPVLDVPGDLNHFVMQRNGTDLSDDNQGPDHQIVLASGIDPATGSNYTVMIGDINGTSGAEVIHGLGGNDWISGGGAADRLYGDAGDDLLFLDYYGLGPVADALADGGSGRDILYGTGAGNSHLIGGHNDDAADGADLIISNGGGNDHIEGGNGNDVLFDNAGQDILDGGLGDDYLFSNTCIGSAGRNWSITPVLDTINGVQRTVDMSGDITYIFPVSQMLNAGDFTPSTDNQGDILLGGAGNDYLLSSAGDDYLDAGSTDDTAANTNVLFAGLGNDTLIGGPGATGCLRMAVMTGCSAATGTTCCLAIMC